MSDFLSNFTNDNYKNKKSRKTKRKQRSSSRSNAEMNIGQDYDLDGDLYDSFVDETQKVTENQINDLDGDVYDSFIDEPKAVVSRLDMHGAPQDEQTVIDPNYNQKKRKKIGILATAVAIGVIIFIVLFNRMTTVKVPDFMGQNISEVREWAATEKIKISQTQDYNFDTEVNTILSQTPEGDTRMKRKDKLELVVGIGPDPKEKIELPDFKKMSLDDARDWVEAQKATSVVIKEEYSDTISTGSLIKQDFSNANFDPKEYTREDTLILTYSKGKEKLERTIDMPDFVNKPKADLDAWVKNNAIKATITWVDSDLKRGNVVEQGISPKIKVAKKQAIDFKVSKGKATEVPDFSDYTKDMLEDVKDFEFKVKEQYSETAAYGALLNQSVEAGTRYYEGDDIPIISLTYSVGRPYLRSYLGELEGDLAGLFFDDYQSKGANITYTTYRVASSAPKGTVVEMGTYNEFVSLNYAVGIGISDGSQSEPEPVREPEETEESEESEEVTRVVDEEYEEYEEIMEDVEDDA